MGTGIYRRTGIVLSGVVALLGMTVSILLYFIGKDGLDVLYKDYNYFEEEHPIRKRLPTDDWYGVLLDRCWAFGFIFIIPGLIGMTASMIFERILVIVHFIVGVLALVVGSFMYTAGAYALALYRGFVVAGIGVKYDTWPWDCQTVSWQKDAFIQHEFRDERCEAGRRASIYVVAATSASLVAWVFLLSHLLFCACTFHITGKRVAKEKIAKDCPPRRFDRRQKHQTSPSESTLMTDTPVPVTGVTFDDDEPSTSQPENWSTPSTSQNSPEEFSKSGAVGGLGVTDQSRMVTFSSDKQTEPDINDGEYDVHRL